MPSSEPACSTEQKWELLPQPSGEAGRIDTRLARRFELFATMLSLSTAVICFSNLIGWVAGQNRLTSWFTGQVSMKPNTSFAVMTCGLGVFLINFRSLNLLWRRLCVLAMACLSLLVSGATLAEYVFKTSFGIDKFFLPEGLEQGHSLYPGRMAPNSALIVAMLSVALALVALGSKRARAAAQSLSIASFVLGALALFGYTYGIRALYGVSENTSMAVQAAVCLTILAASLAFSTTDLGFMALLASNGSGSLMLRRILPLAIVLPWAFGWLSWYGKTIGLYADKLDNVFFAAALMILLSTVLYLNARSLNRIDAERENTKEVLRRNSEQWQLTFNCMSEGLSYHDVDYTVTGTNTAFRNLMPECSAVEGKKCYSIVHGTSDPIDDCPMRRTLESGRTEISETYEPTIGKHLRVRTDPVRDSNGTIFRIVHVVEDITERKKAEENIRRLASIVEQSDDAIFSNDLEGRILSWNKGAERIYGYSAQEALGRTLDMMCPPEAPADFREILVRIPSGDTVKNVEKIRIRKNGSRFWVSLTVSPMRDEHGNVVGCSAIARDITDAKNAEREIERRGIEAQQARAQLAAVVDSMGEGLYQLDRDGRVVFMNTACERLLGYNLDEIRGQRMHDVIHASHPDKSPRPFHECPLVRVMQEGLVHHQDEDYFQRKDGTFFPVEYTSSPLMSQAGITGAVLSFRDVTERKRAEEERNRLLVLERQARRELEAKKLEVEKLNAELEDRVRMRTSELEVANKELEAFSYSVSHDLRAPLRSLDGFSHILLDEYRDKLDDEGRHFLSRLRSASQQMGQLIDALLQLSRMSRTEMNKVQMDLTAMARGIVAELQKQSPERQVNFRIDDKMSCMGDPQLMSVVLHNLLGNAWKFTNRRERADIEFGVANVDGLRTFFVRDNGAGFDMTYANKLFGAFQRLHSASEFEGSGIGLATVQRIVRRHGGRVWAEGKMNEGATFYFTIGS